MVKPITLSLNHIVPPPPPNRINDLISKLKSNISLWSCEKGRANPAPYLN